MALDIGIGRKKASASTPAPAPTPAPDTIIEEPIGEEPFRFTEFAPLDAPVAEAPMRRPPGTQRISRPALRTSSSGNSPLVERMIAWKLPLIGDKPVNVQVQILFTLLAVFALLITAIVRDRQPRLDQRRDADRDRGRHADAYAAPGESGANAVDGNLIALSELRDSRDASPANIDALKKAIRRATSRPRRSESSARSRPDGTVARERSRGVRDPCARKNPAGVRRRYQEHQRHQPAPASADRRDHGAQAAKRRTGARNRRGRPARDADATARQERELAGQPAMWRTRKSR